VTGSDTSPDTGPDTSPADRPHPAGDDGAPRPSMFLVRGDASAEEIAALVAVLQAVAARADSAGPVARVTSQWSAPRRRMRGPHAAGPGGWRASALPR
jgi:hypothetical protein